MSDKHNLAGQKIYIKNLLPNKGSWSTEKGPALLKTFTFQAIKNYTYAIRKAQKLVLVMIQK